MNSVTQDANKNQDDLIDFCSTSPVLALQKDESLSLHCVSDNLLDTELPILDQKLQTATFSDLPEKKSDVELEDILVTIDGIVENSTNGNDLQTSISTDFLENSEESTLEKDNSKTKDVTDEEHISTTSPEYINNKNNNIACDFFPVCSPTPENTSNESEIEALLVLKSLDDLLNETLRQSDENLYNEDEEKTQTIIEDCLLDLDNYLEALDGKDLNDHDSVANSSCMTQDEDTSRESINLSDYTGSNESFDDSSDESNEEFNEEAARQELRQIEENYRKFFAFGCVNEGYLNTETITEISEHRRPLSANIERSEPLIRTQPSRATVAVIRKKRPRVLVNQRKSFEYDQNNSNDIARGCYRISVRPDGDTHEDIRLNGSLARDVSIERQAHASADCCTATVIVEPLRKENEPQELPKALIERNTSSIWRRNSMRRIEQLLIPTIEVSLNNSSVISASHITTNAIVRPVSAPSRLSVSRTSSRRSRSRSRDSRVSLEPNGRARSSSASSRSRRPRSLSSSVSSLASSVESASVPEPARSVAATESNSRRYSLLIAGVIYGATRNKALKIKEAGREDEKKRKIAERNARLAEEKRQSTLRDIEQLNAIFKVPPPPSDDPKIVDKTSYTLSSFEDGYSPKDVAKHFSPIFEPEQNLCKDDSLLNDFCEKPNLPDTDFYEGISQDMYSKPLDLQEPTYYHDNQNQESVTDIQDPDSGYFIKVIPEGVPFLPPEEVSDKDFVDDE